MASGFRKILRTIRSIKTTYHDIEFCNLPGNTIPGIDGCFNSINRYINFLQAFVFKSAMVPYIKDMKTLLCITEKTTQLLSIGLINKQ